MKTILKLFVLFVVMVTFSFSFAQVKLPGYYDIKNQMQNMLYEITSQINEEINQRVIAYIEDDRELYFSKKILKIDLECTSYFCDFRWKSTISIEGVHIDNIAEKGKVIKSIILQEMKLQKENNELLNDSLVQAYSSSLRNQSVEDKVITVGIDSERVFAWIQLPSLLDDSSDQNHRWLRTTISAAKNITQTGETTLGLKSTLYTLSFSPSVIVEVGAIEGKMHYDPSNDHYSSLIIDIANITRTSHIAINEMVNFFVTYGIGLSVDFIFRNNSDPEIDFYSKYVGRVGIVLENMVIMSIGYDSKMNYEKDENKSGMTEIDFELIINTMDFSLTFETGYTILKNAEKEAFMANPGWFCRSSITVKLD